MNYELLAIGGCANGEKLTLVQGQSYVRTYRHENQDGFPLGVPDLAVVAEDYIVAEVAIGQKSYRYLRSMDLTPEVGKDLLIEHLLERHL